MWRRSPLQPVVHACLANYRRYEVLQLGAARGGWKFVLLARLSPIPNFIVNYALWQVRISSSFATGKASWFTPSGSAMLFIRCPFTCFSDLAGWPQQSCGTRPSTQGSPLEGPPFSWLTAMVCPLQVPAKDFLWPTIGALPVVLQTVYLGHLLPRLATLPAATTPAGALRKRQS